MIIENSCPSICLPSKSDLLWSVLNFWGEEEDLGAVRQRGDCRRPIFFLPFAKPIRKPQMGLAIFILPRRIIRRTNLPLFPTLIPTMRIAITADLHWGHNRRGDEATPTAAASNCGSHPPDLLLLGGDIGTERAFRRVPATLRATLPCPQGARARQSRHLGQRPTTTRRFLAGLSTASARSVRSIGYHYLDHGPLHPAGRRTWPSSARINWYDYSWSHRAA